MRDVYCLVFLGHKMKGWSVSCHGLSSTMGSSIIEWYLLDCFTTEKTGCQHVIKYRRIEVLNVENRPSGPAMKSIYARVFFPAVVVRVAWGGGALLLN